MRRIKFFIVVIVAITLSSCIQSEKRKESTQPDESHRKEIVKAMELQYRTVARSVECPATLVAYEEVHLVPASPGRIEKIHGEIGDRVSKGTPLVQMDRTQLHQAEIQLKNLELDFRRLDTLAKYGSIAQQQYDQLKTQYDIAKSNVEFLKENTRLLAPFNGVISGRYFESGEMFSGTPNTPAGKAAVLSIVQIDRLKAVISMSEKYFPMVKTGMESSIKIDTYSDRSFTGRILRIHPTVNPIDRTFNVEVLISNRENLFRPGMFCRVTLDLDKEEAILLPSIAVLKMQGSNERYLFVNENGKAKRISVTIGKRYDDDIEVFSDELQAGDQVIITGQARLLNGIPIDVIN